MKSKLRSAVAAGPSWPRPPQRGVQATLADLERALTAAEGALGDSGLAGGAARCRPTPAAGLLGPALAAVADLCQQGKVRLAEGPQHPAVLAAVLSPPPPGLDGSTGTPTGAGWGGLRPPPPGFPCSCAPPPEAARSVRM